MEAGIFIHRLHHSRNRRISGVLRKTDFGITKIVFDVFMAVTAGVLAIVFFGKLQGVREGTVAEALLVGFTARTWGKLLSFLPQKIYRNSNAK